MNGEAGVAVTPLGSPVTEMLTVPAKPFLAATETTIGGLLVPTLADNADGATENVKSGARGGGAICELPSPQPTEKPMAQATTPTNNPAEEEARRVLNRMAGGPSFPGSISSEGAPSFAVSKGWGTLSRFGY